MKSMICLSCMIVISAAWPVLGMLVLDRLYGLPVIGFIGGAGLIMVLWAIFTLARF